ncbi:MAG: hypothetical protein A2667_00085 [Candidatus Wildermuthbacteria bacterium RIFCSPHIGHO2_01_FULL_47_27]|nr:MAG: hypothetical protein A2667_00085 [Candidatus Wildermuthbacteria bacterium RIFCSPHIGHO2_01_FULL_47_27]
MRKSRKTRKGLGANHPWGVGKFSRHPIFSKFERARICRQKLEIVNVLGFAFRFARPPNPSRAKRGEDRIPFELFQEYSATTIWYRVTHKLARP